MITKQKVNKEEETEDRQSVFACLAHDLKTPIFAQLKILDLILSNNFGEITHAQREVMIELRNSCVYMKNLSQNILSLYSFLNNQMKLQNEIFCPNEVIKEIIQELSVFSEEKHQWLTYITESGSSCFLGDKIQIKRCMVNLVSNAIAHSPVNSEIIIKSDKTRNEFIFSVTNKSSYPLPETMEMFFDKFKTINSQGSSGLGLYIVKQIILAHNGRVFAKKNENNSCTFGFKIPVNL